MTQSREALAMMDGTAVTFSKRRGYVVSRWGVIIITGLFLASIVATGLLVYKFASCSIERPHSTDGVQNGDQDAKVLIPEITTEVTVPHTPPSTKSPKLDVRLPRAIRPDSYLIKIMPFIYEGNFTFNGEVSIVVNVTEDTSNITLHFNDMKIHEDSVSVEEYVPGNHLAGILYIIIYVLFIYNTGF